MNSTLLKHRNLAHFPDLQTHKEGRDVLLIFTDDVGPAMKKACKYDADAHAIHLARAAKIVRRAIFNKKTCFTGIPLTVSAKLHQCQIHCWHWFQ